MALNRDTMTDLNGEMHYTPQEIAKMLRVSVQLIHRELKHGRIKGFKVGGRWRISECALDELMNRK